MIRDKGLWVKHTFDNDFVHLFEELEDKYDKEIFSIQGIANDKMDIVKFSKEFFNKSAGTADVSVDANANVSANKDMNKYNSESDKARRKLNSIYLIYKYVKENFDKDSASKAVERVINGELFVNDLKSISKPYCYAFDLNKLITDGMDFYDRLDIGPPQRSQSFINLVIQTTSFISNQITGAVSYPSFFPVLNKFYEEEFGKDYINTIDEEGKNKIEQQFQNLVYSLNFPFRAAQAPYTNLSVMDKGFLNSLFDGYTIDGEPLTDKNIDNSYELSKWFFEYFNEINGKENMFTFPVVTHAISIDEEGEYVDPDFVEWSADTNSDQCLSNVYIDEPTSFSSCCFTGEQKCLTKSSNGVNYMSFEELSNSKYKENKNNFTIFHNGSWVKGKEIQFDAPDYMYKVTTSNNKEIVVTPDHLNPTLRGDVSSKNLTTNDYLLFNENELNTYGRVNEDLDYSDGFIIGCFIGDGSFGGAVELSNGDTQMYETHFSMNVDSYEKVMKHLEMVNEKLGGESSPRLGKGENNNYPVRISSRKLVKFIKKWSSGKRAENKELNLDCLLQSAEFRKGILDGWYHSDGGNSNRCYTTSYKLAEQMEVLITSLGKTSVVDVEDRTGEDKIEIRGQKFDRNYPLYCVRWYDSSNRRSMKDVYQIRNNSIYFKIDSIEKIDTDEEEVYCFEIENEYEPYFTLPNGIITHNCRLRNDYEKLSNGYQNSFGVGGLSVGSLRVAGLNLARIGVLEEQGYDNRLEEDIEIVHKILYSQRQLIEERIEDGFMPLYDYDWIHTDRQYSTIGFVGGYEYVKNKGYDIRDKPDVLKSALDKVNNKIDKWEDEEDSNIYNIEQIPAESMAVRLAKIDDILGYNKEGYELYSNQYLPLIDGSVSIKDRFDVQGYIDDATSGGAILHINIEDNTKLDENLMYNFMETARETNTKYFGVNYIFNECENGHYSIGDDNYCSECGGDIIEQYTRVVGFITPVSDWNETRKDYEFDEREFY